MKKRWWIVASVAAVVILTPSVFVAASLSQQVAQARAAEAELAGIVSSLQIPADWTELRADGGRHFDGLGFCWVSALDVRTCPTFSMTYAPPQILTSWKELAMILPDAQWLSTWRECTDLATHVSGRSSACKADAVVGNFHVAALLSVQLEIPAKATDPLIDIRIEPTGP